MGRFLTKDTWIGGFDRPSSLNRWNYVEGNPINYTDPTGFYRCPWNPVYECTWDDILAYYSAPLLRSLGIQQNSYRLNIPGVGEINTTGTPVRIMAEVAVPYGQTMHTIANVGSGLLFGPVDPYGTAQLITATDLIGYQYSPTERLWLSAFFFFDFRNCFRGITFAPDLGGGGGLSSGAKRYFVNGSWSPKPNAVAVKFGYDENLRKYINKIPGASFLLPESWFDKGLISSNALESGNWQVQALEAMENSTQINFIVDGMDILRFPVEDLKPAYGHNMPIATHWEMDQIITRGYVDKLHLWNNGVELTGSQRLQWISRWKAIRDIP